jgi:hypothetical protein
MHFQAARPDVIRAINQRWLLKYWEEARGGERLPPWRELKDRAFGAMSANLSFTDVVGSNGDMRFLIRYHGSRIGEAYGSDCHGRHLDEILPAAFRDAALATYRHVVTTAQPVYTSVDVSDSDGRLVYYERLLLPFGRDRTHVDRILASLELVSPDGAFNRRNLMTSTTPSAFKVCATIQEANG